MTDEQKALIERLREVGRDGVWKSGRNPATAHPMCIEAAATIEVQTREIESLREALRLVQDTVPDHEWDNCQLNGYLPCNCEFGPMHDKIRAALEGTSHD